MRASTPALRLVIVEDEPLARDCIRLALAEREDVRIVAECPTAAEAVRTIEREAPDLVLLDLQLPDADGFSVVDAIGPDRMPPVIIVTAHDDRALQAFDIHAVDYLLKPFEDDRLLDAVGRARQQRSTPDPERGTRMEAVLAYLRGPDGTHYAERITVREGDRIRFIAVEDVHYVTTAGNMIDLHLAEGPVRLRGTLQGLQDRLDPTRFVRIHRGTLVRLAAIAEVRPWFGGDYMAILHDGTQLRVSRTYRDDLLRPTH